MKKKRMNEFGNVLPIAVVGLIVIVMVILTSQNLPQTITYSDTNSYSRINFELESVIDTGIKNTISEFAKSGFTHSDNSKTWFFNGLYLPLPEEIDSNLNSLIKDRMKLLFDGLRLKRNYDLNTENIDINFVFPYFLIEETNIYDVFDALKTKKNIGLKYNIIVGTMSGNEEQGIKKNFNYASDKQINTNLLLMYSRLADWATDELNELDLEISYLLEKMGPCQANKCSCININKSTTTSLEVLEEIGLNSKIISDDFNKLINTKVDLLNSFYFDQTPITCEAKINRLDVNADFNIFQECIPLGKEGLDSTKQKLCGSETIRYSSSLSYVSFEEPNWSNDSSKQRGLYFGNLSWSETAVDLSDGKSLNCDPSEYVARDEQVVINPYIKSEVIITCTDPTTPLSLSSELDFLKSEVRLRIGLKKNCDKADIIIEDSSELGCIPTQAGGGGEGCPSSGTCTPYSGEECLGRSYGCLGELEVIGHNANGCKEYKCVGEFGFTEDVDCCKLPEDGPGDGTGNGNGTGIDECEEGGDYGDCAICVCNDKGCTLQTNLSSCYDFFETDDSNKCQTIKCKQKSGTDQYFCEKTVSTCTNNKRPCQITECNSSNGNCEIKQLIVCNDNNACTTDSCVPNRGSPEKGDESYCDYKPLTCSPSNVVSNCGKKTCVVDSEGKGGCQFVESGNCWDQIFEDEERCYNAVCTAGVCGKKLKCNPEEYKYCGEKCVVGSDPNGSCCDVSSGSG